MFLYKAENLKGGGAAKCNYAVYRDTEFILSRLPKMKSFSCFIKVSVSFSDYSNSCQSPQTMFFSLISLLQMMRRWKLGSKGPLDAH